MTKKYFTTEQALAHYIFMHIHRGIFSTPLLDHIMYECYGYYEIMLRKHKANKHEKMPNHLFHADFRVDKSGLYQSYTREHPGAGMTDCKDKQFNNLDSIWDKDGNLSLEHEAVSELLSKIIKPYLPGEHACFYMGYKPDKNEPAIRKAIKHGLGTKIKSKWIRHAFRKELALSKGDDIMMNSINEIYMKTYNHRKKDAKHWLEMHKNDDMDFLAGCMADSHNWRGGKY